MSRLAELAVNRNNTRAFISASPIVVALVRPQRVRTTTGGHAAPTTTTLAPQTFKLIDQSTSGDWKDTMPQRLGGTGEADSVAYILLGLWDADLKKGDWWDDGPYHYAVDHLLPANGYEVRAFVLRSTNGG